ncbi:MAG TPA: hypothetical protein VNI82_00805 [Candidatus Nitrosotenuis sp.]|nr:hypothetical protein [Candidatus Nitrosotenuis sp.]
MSREYFVNRHGKKLDINGAVADIEQNEQKPLVQQSESLQVKQPSAPRLSGKITRPKMTFPKKTLIILSALILVAVFSLIVVADTARRDYQRQTSAMKGSVVEAQKHSISADTSAYDASRGLLDKLKKYDACQTSAPELISKNYDPAKDALSECSETLASYNNVRQQLESMKVASQYLESQKKALAPALKLSVNGEFAEIPSNATAWQTSFETVQKIKPPREFEKTHEKLVEDVETVSRAWVVLSDAARDQSAEGFTRAEAVLTRAYETLRGSGDEFDTLVLAQQKSLDMAVSSFTN